MKIADIDGFDLFIFLLVAGLTVTTIIEESCKGAASVVRAYRGAPALDAGAE